MLERDVARHMLPALLVFGPIRLEHSQLPTEVIRDIWMVSEMGFACLKRGRLALVRRDR